MLIKCSEHWLDHVYTDRAPKVKALHSSCWITVKTTQVILDPYNFLTYEEKEKDKKKFTLKCCVYSNAVKDKKALSYGIISALRGTFLALPSLLLCPPDALAHLESSPTLAIVSLPQQISHQKHS